MSGMFGRFSDIVKAKMNRAMDEAEDPGEMLEYSYEQQLQMLQKALLPGIGGSEIRRAQEGLVRRDAAGRNKLLGQERVTVNCHAFMRGSGPHRVHRVRLRREAAEPPQTHLGFPDPWVTVASTGPRAWDGKHHFPEPGRAVVGIFCQQFMEKGRTAPRHAGDEHGALDGRAFTLKRVLPPRINQPQARFQKIPQVNPHEEASERMQARFRFQAVDEDRQRRLDRRIAEVLEAGATLCGGAEGRAVEGAQLSAQRVAESGPRGSARPPSICPRWVHTVSRLMVL